MTPQKGDPNPTQPTAAILPAVLRVCYRCRTVFMLVLLWFFCGVRFGCCSVCVCLAVVTVVVLVLRSFAALVLICVLRVCGVLLFAPWFYAGCTVGGSAKTMVRLRAIVLAAFVAIILLF